MVCVVRWLRRSLRSIPVGLTGVVSLTTYVHNKCENILFQEVSTFDWTYIELVSLHDFWRWIIAIIMCLIVFIPFIALQIN